MADIAAAAVLEGRVWYLFVCMLKQLEHKGCTGGNLNIILGKLQTAKLEITSAWSETCQVEGNLHPSIKASELANTLQLSSAESDSTDTIKLKLTVPERMNIKIEGRKCDIVFKNKFLGDLDVQITDGDIYIDKHRGERISILTDRAKVFVKTVLEGNIQFFGDSFEAKLLHANSAMLQANNFIDIKAIYVKTSTMHAKDGISVGLFQGIGEMRSQVGSISVGKAIGSIDARCLNGDITVAMEDMLVGHDSCFLSENGNVRLDLEPKIKASVECCRFPNTLMSMAEFNLNLKQFKTFKGTTSTTSAIGATDNQLHENKSPYINGKFTSGKINVRGTAKGDQFAYQYFLDMNNTEIAHKKSAPVESSRSSSPVYDNRVTVMAGKQLCISSTSWIDSLRAKYGLESTSKKDDGA